nr:MAG TPA: hypothetical protein [Caudoviricetes sp.]
MASLKINFIIPPFCATSHNIKRAFQLCLTGFYIISA